MSDDTPPPTAKYRYTLQISGNTLDDVEHELWIAVNDWSQDTRNRDEFAIQGGTYTRTLIVADPDQTPDKYAADLEAWMNTRKEARRNA